MTTIEDTTEGHRPHEVLARSRELIDPALRAAVDGLPSAIRRIVGYHFGWCDENGVPSDDDSGKAIRPTLSLLAAEAVGGSSGSGVSAAVAVELVHNFSLLHDDIMDGDTTRRHRPAAWTVFGANPTILAGDALQTLALDVLAAGGHPAAQDGVRMLSAAVLDLINGQVADLDFETRDDVGLAECVRMAELKTGALLGCACALGALFGGAPDKAEPLRRLGLAFGTAFQHVDDLLGIWGSPETTGKSIHSDLRSRKKSLPVVAALTSDTSAGRELAGLYFRERELSDVELARAAELVEAAGGREWSRRQADDLMERAMGELRDADLVRRPAEELGALARFATRRDH
ncbi:MAG TPA: polyprenyl synthetase family protein [Nocardiopsis listeri]|uniref:family 2 encapsulin nanocompartment cargo protein polyprenyl transferase n=1 Tax=Nocardiopsis listeri TaxID=53440 RepID=UPI001E09ED37|nr:family 2 encapsulin nanocompartment cargo protein polyprenyl transferase [Nocardiopsis listeri]HJE61662.1 polyprenyl synthetase family protein [Nocardiopsis listeri]